MGAGWILVTQQAESLEARNEPSLGILFALQSPAYLGPQPAGSRHPERQPILNL